MCKANEVGKKQGGVDARLCARFARTRRPPSPPAIKGRGPLGAYISLRSILGPSLPARATPAA